MENNKKRPALSKKRDIILLGIMVILLASWMLWSFLLKPRFSSPDEQVYAWIFHENELLHKVALDGEIHTFNLELEHDQEIHKLQIETYSDYTIAVVKSNCPDKICVNTGKVSIMGQSIACLPNHVIIKIGSQDNPIGEGGIDG